MVNGGRRYHKSAIASNIQASPNFSGCGLYVNIAAGMAKVYVRSPAGPHARRWWELAMNPLKLVERRTSDFPVDVEHHESEICAGCDSDIGAWPLGPPEPNLILVTTCLFWPFSNNWVLTRAAAYVFSAGASIRARPKARNDCEAGPDVAQSGSHKRIRGGVHAHGVWRAGVKPASINRLISLSGIRTALPSRTNPIFRRAIQARSVGGLSPRASAA